MVSSANPMKFGRMKLHPATVLRQTSRLRCRRTTGPLDAGGGACTIVVAMCSPGTHSQCGVPGVRPTAAGHTIMARS